MLHATLDMGKQHVTITAWDECIRMGFEHDQARVRAFDNSTDSEDSISASEGQELGTDGEDD